MQLFRANPRRLLFSGSARISSRTRTRIADFAERDRLSARSCHASTQPRSSIPPPSSLGNVTLGARVSVWPTAVIRGDSDSIVIGDDSNVQDGTIIHVDHGVPTTIGNRVAIGHRAIVHGATIEDDCLIAMGAILLNGVHVGTGSIVGAGAVVREGMRIPPNSLVLGVPRSCRLGDDG